MNDRKIFYGLGLTRVYTIYDKNNKQSSRVTLVDLNTENSITITDFELSKTGDIWFSTLEKGMGFYSTVTGEWFFCPVSPLDKNVTFPHYSIKNFCRISANESFIAVSVLYLVFLIPTAKHTPL
jgi:hypothetical protein